MIVVETRREGRVEFRRLETSETPAPARAGYGQPEAIQFRYVTMNKGAKPLGERAMTNAERQAKFRAAHKDGTPKIHYRKPGDRRSRNQRWRDAVAELVELQQEYQAWLDALPESLSNSATAAALQTICELDLSELEDIEPPRGYGRD